MTRKHTPLSAGEADAVERLVVDTQFRLHQLMLAEKVSKSELAARLKCSKSRVTQMFGDKPNLTLETLARVFHALGDEPRVTSDRLDAIVDSLRKRIRAENTGSRERTDETWTVRVSRNRPLPGAVLHEGIGPARVLDVVASRTRLRTTMAIETVRMVVLPGTVRETWPQFAA